ncbi:ABC-type polar amino acid transport system ATPase subunit [Bartonella fuyuanensis]|uniref:ABC-type polar amino acid transport system ATPase subunit n=1 Tax=Bartonella fuyuanensis TaxID=1460968 RepID=A0A840E2D7_9HYPH|nr:ABC-type polar amino acid transport system ATPase subunit [Bartonella fuyuanensis]
MLFDEQTSTLDPEIVGRVLDVMLRLAEEGMTMICVAPEMRFAQKFPERIIFIDQGIILEDCSSKELFSVSQARTPRTQEFLSKIPSC